MRTNVGQYRIEGFLGRGGMGVVYRGVHDHLGRPVAIKELAPELTQQPEFKERFFSEAKTQALLQHPNIVAVYDLVEDAGEYFIVMELVSGEPLDERLKAAAGHGMDLGEALGIFGQILAALDYAHSEGVIHRDVKPSNALITAQGKVKLMDFGIALLIGDKRLTASQSTIGTPTYMSPEQILRPRSVDHRSDIYSAAVVFFEMLAGKLPFDGDTEYAIKKLQIEALPPDLTLLNPQLPAGVATTVGVALSKDPNDRFQSAGAFLRALQEAASMALVPPIGATPPPMPPPIHRRTVLEAVPRTGMAPGGGGLGAGGLPPGVGGLGQRPGRLLHSRNTWLGLGTAALVLVIATVIIFAAFRSRGGGNDQVAAPPPAAAPPAVAGAAMASANSSTAGSPGGTPVLTSAVQVAQGLVPPTSAAVVPPPAATPPTPDAEHQRASPPSQPAHIKRPKLERTDQTQVSPPPVAETPPLAQAPAAKPEDEEPPRASGRTSLSVEQLNEMREVVDNLRRLGEQAQDASEHDAQKTAGGLRLGDFVEAAGEVKTAFQIVTGRGVKGMWGRLRHKSTPEVEQKDLEVKARDLVRQGKEIDRLLHKDALGPASMEYWSEVMRYLRRLDGFYR